MLILFSLFYFFDFEGKNFMRVFGRMDNGKRACIIDHCEVYFWAILKENCSDSRINFIQKKIREITISNNIRESQVLKTEVHMRNFLGKKVKAIKCLP